MTCRRWEAAWDDLSADAFPQRKGAACLQMPLRSLLTREVLGERKATRLEHNKPGRARHGRAVLRGEATFRGVNGWQSYGS